MSLLVQCGILLASLAWCKHAYAFEPRAASSSLRQEIHPHSYLESQVKRPQNTVSEAWASHSHLANWPEIRDAAADTWNVLPKQYDPAFKNPCWSEEGTGKLRCLPYFQILGVSKCGTTDLYHRLEYHPDFASCPWKGPHFWDEESYPTRKQPKEDKYDGSFKGYVTVFDKPAKDIVQDPSTRITGEASSNTFTGVAAYLRGSTVAKHINATLAEYIWEAAPWSRFIVLFRDPVKRYYSAYYYYRSKASGPGSPEDFHRRAVTEIRQWDECMKMHKNVEHMCIKKYVPQQLIKGMYALFLPYWLQVFPRDQMLFMRNEDYKAASVEHVLAAADFLGLRRLDNDTWLQGARKAKSRNVKSYPDMLPETQRLLQDFFRPFNQRLSKAFNNDPRWLWGY